MFWIFATTAFLVVFGGILFVLPSKKERQIGRMRIDARKSGLQTQGIVVADVNAPAAERVTAGGKIRTPRIQCVAWEKKYMDEYTEIPTWILYKSSRENGPIEGFVVEPQLKEMGLEHQQEYWSRVGRAIKRLPNKLVAVKSGRNGVTWIGQERLNSTPSEFVSEMLAGLEDLSTANIELAQSRFNG